MLDKFKKVILPIIKRVGKFDVMADDILGVQPMTVPTGEVFTLRVVDDHVEYPGTIIHDFMLGYGIIDNDMEFVPMHEFLERPLDFEI